MQEVQKVCPDQTCFIATSFPQAFPVIKLSRSVLSRRAGSGKSKHIKLGGINISVFLFHSHGVQQRWNLYFPGVKKGPLVCRITLIGRSYSTPVCNIKTQNWKVLYESSLKKTLEQATEEAHKALILLAMAHDASTSASLRILIRGQEP